jgi:hypothetical protein
VSVIVNVLNSECLFTRMILYSILYIFYFVCSSSYTVLLRCRGCFIFLWISTLSAGFLGRVIGPSQGHYLKTGQHKHRINANTHTHTPNIHTLSGIRAHDHSVRANEDSLCLRPLGLRDRLIVYRQPILWIRIGYKYSNLTLTDTWWWPNKGRNMSCL